MVQRSAVLLILVAPAWRPLTTALHRHARLPRVAKRDDAARRDPAGGPATRGCVRGVEVAKARCGDVRAVVRSGTPRAPRRVSRKCPYSTRPYLPLGAPIAVPVIGSG